MNKNQQKIYNWLLEHPGYLKKSPYVVWGYFGNDELSIENTIKPALKQARIDSKPLSKSYKVDIRNNQESIRYS